MNRESIYFPRGGEINPFHFIRYAFIAHYLRWPCNMATFFAFGRSQSPLAEMIIKRIYPVLIRSLLWDGVTNVHIRIYDIVFIFAFLHFFNSFHKSRYGVPQDRLNYGLKKSLHLLLAFHQPRLLIAKRLHSPVLCLLHQRGGHKR